MPNATIWLSSLISTAAVSAISWVGLVALELDEQRVRRAAAPLVALGIGTLLGDAFIHLVPSALEGSGPSPLEPSLLVLAGVLVFFSMDRLARHGRDAPGVASGSTKRELVTLNLVGDGIHNFVDGVLIAASYLASPSLGLSTTLAVICHELPQELSDFAILVHAGLEPRRAVRLNLMSASAALLGSLCGLSIGATAGATITRALIPLTAGGFVYIAVAQLMPELPRRRGALGMQITLISLGIAVMAALTVLE